MFVQAVVLVVPIVGIGDEFGTKVVMQFLQTQQQRIHHPRASFCRARTRHQTYEKPQALQTRVGAYLCTYKFVSSPSRLHHDSRAHLVNPDILLDLGSTATERRYQARPRRLAGFRHALPVDRVPEIAMVVEVKVGGGIGLARGFGVYCRGRLGAERGLGRRVLKDCGSEWTWVGRAGWSGSTNPMGMVSLLTY
uniref:Secreted protein n=1 Tax=Mycena chlorophos TaxID=658473 RepID=A0ABQ0LIS6_MYCCL|nr:predicted protein [Mycena chlorophos]